MSGFITLSCPSCGHKLQITEDVERFACAACGNEHVVNRTGGIISLKPVIDGIKGVKVGVDKTSSELAIARLKEEIRSLESEMREIDTSRGNKGKPGFWGSIVLIIFGIIIGLPVIVGMTNPDQMMYDTSPYGIAAGIMFLLAFNPISAFFQRTRRI